MRQIELLRGGCSMRVSGAVGRIPMKFGCLNHGWLVVRACVCSVRDPFQRSRSIMMGMLSTRKSSAELGVSWDTS